jgi:hypothetical protein
VSFSRQMSVSSQPSHDGHHQHHPYNHPHHPPPHQQGMPRPEPLQQPAVRKKGLTRRASSASVRQRMASSDTLRVEDATFLGAGRPPRQPTQNSANYYNEAPFFQQYEYTGKPSSRRHASSVGKENNPQSVQYQYHPPYLETKQDEQDGATRRPTRVEGDGFTSRGRSSGIGNGGEMPQRKGSAASMPRPRSAPPRTNVSGSTTRSGSSRGPLLSSSLASTQQPQYFRASKYR